MPAASLQRRRASSRFRGRGTALAAGAGCLLLALALAPAAGAQEALRSAIELDHAVATASRAPSIPESSPGTRVGPVDLVLGAYTRTGFDDNVGLAQENRVSDASVSGGMTVKASWALTDSSMLRFGTGVGYVHYVRGTRPDGLELEPDSALLYQASFDDLALTLFDQFSYTRLTLTDGALANLPVLPRLDNASGLRLNWTPREWTLEAGYTHDVFLSDSRAYEYLNRASEFVVVRAGRRLAESTELGIEGTATLSAYSVSRANDSRNFSVGPYLEWKIRPSLQVHLRGGPSRTVFTAPGSGPAIQTYFALAEVSHQLTEFVGHQLSVVRDVQPGLNQGSTYIEQLRLTYSASWSPAPWMDLAASLTWEDGRQPLPLPGPGGSTLLFTERFDRLTAGTRLVWHPTRRLDVSASFSHSLRHSSLALRNYTANSLTLQVSRTF